MWWWTSVDTRPTEQRELPLLSHPSYGATGDDVVVDERRHEANLAEGIAPPLEPQLGSDRRRRGGGRASARGGPKNVRPGIVYSAASRVRHPLAKYFKLLVLLSDMWSEKDVRTGMDLRIDPQAGPPSIVVWARASVPPDLVFIF